MSIVKLGYGYAVLGANGTRLAVFQGPGCLRRALAFVRARS